MILFCVIFLAEVTVVTFGTLRIIFISRGHKIIAPALGFFEVSIWLFAMTQTMGNLNKTGPSDWSLAEWSCFLAFALGFTLGNFFGILIEKGLALGSLKLHIFTQRDANALVRNLRSASFGATVIQGQGATGPVDVIMTVIRRRQLGKILAIIQDFDPRAFYAVDEVQMTSAGIFPLLPRKEVPSVQYTWHMVAHTDPAEMTESMSEKVAR